MIEVLFCLFLNALKIYTIYKFTELLYDYAKQKGEEKHRLQLVMFQNQLEIMRSANDAYKNMRHDMRHHTLMLSEYIGKGEKEKALKYLEKMNSYIETGRQYVDTGNVCIDSIFNYVIDEVNKIGGNINTDIKIGEDLLIDDFVVNVILSNLLINACEAIQKSKKKEINVSVRFDRGALKIRVCNTYAGTIIKNSKGFQSTKENKKGHGIGLASVRKSVESYGGEMKIDYTEEVFCVDILLYL